ncbi:MAG: hypothetical protein KF891_12640 [Rhizobacter sp.]|nr:hypothetical protein [Rhizobacter sp.]
MTLEPKLPPGRANRKALRFSVDIRRLRNAGYTFSAIRMALLDAGVEVSLTTIKREAARPGSDPLVARRIGTGQHVPSTPVAMVGIPATSPSHGRGASGREIAEAFFNANPSNPLLPTKESS